jgi:hypothetical protein
MASENEHQKPDTHKDNQKKVIPEKIPARPDKKSNVEIKRGGLSGDSTTKPPISRPKPPKKGK